MGQWRQPVMGLQKHPRVTTSVSVRVSTVDPEIDPTTGRSFFRSVEETTANLSRGGAFVRSWEPLAAGRRVLVEIELYEGLSIQLEGRVAWTRREVRPAESDAAGGVEPTGYGVEFLGGSSFEIAMLDRFLTGLESRERTNDAPDPSAPTALP